MCINNRHKKMIEKTGCGFRQNIYPTNMQKCVKNCAENFNNSICESEYFSSLKGKNLSYVNFCGGISGGGDKISESERKEIKAVLRNCRYTKLPAILNYEDIKITKTENENGAELIIEGFDTPDTDTMNGICGELAPKALQKLNETLGDKLLFTLVDGYSIKYDMMHNFIVAFKNTPENKARLENASGISRKDFKNAIVIDPSFNLIADADENGNFEEYLLFSLLKSADEINTKEFPLNESGKTGEMPLGYVEELIPEIKNEYPANALLFFGLSYGADDKTKRANFYLCKDESGVDYDCVNDVIEALPKEHIIRKFADKIKFELTKI